MIQFVKMAANDHSRRLVESPFLSTEPLIYPIDLSFETLVKFCGCKSAHPVLPGLDVEICTYKEACKISSAPNTYTNEYRSIDEVSVSIVLIPVQSVPTMSFLHFVSLCLISISFPVTSASTRLFYQSYRADNSKYGLYCRHYPCTLRY